MNIHLDRFKEAQETDYSIALQEIQNGRKESHWIWYIFPQLKELGYSSTSQYFGLTIQEAKEYISDSLLRARLIEISNALLELKSNNPIEVMGYTDGMKLNSCMTLFSEIAPEIDVFQKVIQKFFDGKKDNLTLDLLYPKDDLK